MSLICRNIYLSPHLFEYNLHKYFTVLYIHEVKYDNKCQLGVCPTKVAKFKRDKLVLGICIFRLASQYCCNNIICYNIIFKTYKK